MGGMIIPNKYVTELIGGVKEGKISSVEEIYNFLIQVDSDYSKNAWAFTQKLIENLYKTQILKMSKVDLIEIIKDWQDNSVKFNNMILADAQKEFDSISRIGYGIDGDEDIVNADFENVRGTFQDNKFVKELEEESSRVKEIATEMTSMLDKLS